MFKSMKSWFTRTTLTARKQTRRYQPHLECLETRLVPTTTVFTNGVLTILGTNQADTITVRESGNSISIDGFASTYNTTDVKSIVINGQDGADTINLNTNRKAFSNGKLTLVSQVVTVPTTIYGGKGNDTIHGGAGADKIFGEADNDSLFGNAGADTLEGGAGTDTLQGGYGNDVYVFSGSTLGTDTITDTDGAKDSLDFSQFGGGVKLDLALTTSQTVRANHLVLKLSSGTAIEDVFGSEYRDVIKGNSRDNRLDGNGGNDDLFGAGGSDTLTGDADNDRLFGGSDIDWLYGGNGNDFLDDGSRTTQELADGGNGLDFNADILTINGAAANDVKQRNSQTCSFLAAVSSLAGTGHDLSQLITYKGPSDAGIPQYCVRLYGFWGWTDITVKFDGTFVDGDPKAAAEGESWVTLLNRAWIQLHGDSGAMTNEGLRALTGRDAEWHVAVGDLWDSDFDLLHNAISNNKAIVAGTRGDVTNAKLVGDHAYSVIDVWGTGDDRRVQLRNPWGFDGGSQISGANNGIITMTWSSFRKNFLSFSIEA